MARQNSRFGRLGVFVCSDCKRRTRETDSNRGLDSMLCGLCADLAMHQNGISDNGEDSELGREYREESARLRREILKRGGQLNSGMTWAETNPIPVEAA